MIIRMLAPIVAAGSVVAIALAAVPPADPVEISDPDRAAACLPFGHLAAAAWDFNNRGVPIRSTLIRALASAENPGVRAKIRDSVRIAYSTPSAEAARGRAIAACHGGYLGDRFSGS